MQRVFDFNTIASQTNVWEKERNQIIHTPQCTVMTFVLDENWSFYDRGHRSEQLTLVLEGEIEWEMDGVTTKLTAGQGVYIPPNVPHGGRVLTKHARGIDVFVPRRREKRYRDGLIMIG